jgi:hypothetical protein
MESSAILLPWEGIIRKCFGTFVQRINFNLNHIQHLLLSPPFMGESSVAPLNY